MRKISIILLVTIFIFLYGCMPNEKITVSFETNGGSLIEDIIIDSSLNFVLPDDPIKEGYTFLGWYLDNDTFEVEYSNILLTNSLTLYAKWLEEIVIENITISFETNGGNNIEPFQFEVGTSISKPIDPIKEGYEFAGWYSDIELTEVYEFNVMPAESITLYADWGTVGLEYELINNDTEYSVSKGTDIALTEIQIPNMKDGKTVVAINQQGFYNCRNLEYITIPNTIEKIGREAFRNCNNLKSIFIPSRVTEIEDFAFHSCIALTELIIPMSVEIIGEGIVYNTNSLASVYVEALTRPNGWSKLWNSTLKPVFWRYLVIPDTKPIITIVPAMEDLNIGRTTQIIPTITNTTDERLTWSSSNTRVATVDILGVVRGLDFGTTVITATSVADSTVSATVEIQVNMEGSGVLIVTATKTVLATDNLNEQLSVLSAAGTYRDLSECTFTSADPSVVTITSEGIIQAHSRGTTTVRVTHQTFGIGVIKLTVVD